MAFLSNIEYILGELRTIQDLKSHVEDVEVFEARGLKNYACYKNNLIELIQGVLKKVKPMLDKPEKIKYVIFVIDRIDALEKEGYGLETIFNNFLGYIGAPKAVPFLLSILACASTSLALKVACNLINYENADEILMVYANKISANNPRFPKPEISLLSDGALAFSVTKDNIYSGFKILACNHVNDATLNDKMKEGYGEFLESQIDLCKLAFDASLKKSKVKKENLKKVYFNNYMPHLVKMFYSELGINTEQQFLENIQRFAHVYSADTFINLKDNLNQISSNDRLCLLPNSITSWGSIILQKV